MTPMDIRILSYLNAEGALTIAAALSMTVEELWPPRAAPKTFTDLDYVLGASERLGLSMESDRAA